MKKNRYPRFPLYVVSKGRYEYMVTSKALTEMGVKHNVVVEPKEVDAYKKAIKDMGLLATVVPLDMKYKETYELCDDLGLTRSTGPGPARNFVWDHSKSKGHDWHWVMDDNIMHFMRLLHGNKIRIETPAFWRAMEDFVLRYSNVSMAGPNYDFFAYRADMSKLPPFYINTRIYSCNLIRNDVPFRWRGRYNEDTILSLDMLKAGWCTIQFNAFLQNKMGTQVLKGGNTSEFYHAEGTVQPGQRYADTGTLAKSKMQVAVHPDVSKLVWRFNRWHHFVDYNPFKSNKLRLRKGKRRSKKPNEYGIRLRDRSVSN
tara:strand:- start:6841 stop:7782 length:942 start_codon:yes stop_codon:yes gene_type:complete